ncbi:MAG TPA: metalloregulator ArsR/SmtB family transcription factor [Symbiobacteriaceae bacterium]|nr:metalloregulator ArsR/SmtB family transcription factor [Symbiobacteriaceae bacterium]
MEEQILLMKTLSDPTRLKLFKLILREELCVCELQEILQISQPAVSQHIARLKAAGLVRERKAGMWTLYQGDLQRITAALGAMIGFVAADPATIPEMAELLARRSTCNRVELCRIKEEPKP